MENMLTYLKSFLYIIFIYLGIKTGAVKILLVLMLLDSLLGIIKALRLGKSFSFKVLLWGMITKLSIFIVPFIVALMAKALDYDFSYFIIVILNIIIVSEGISCITNIIGIKTKKEVDNTDYITTLLHAIKRTLSEIMKRLLSAIEITNINDKK